MYGDKISNIDIVVTQFTGRVKFCVSVDKIPSLEDSMFRSYDWHILIKSTDPNFKNDGTYFVLVYFDELVSTDQASFSIKWNTANTMNVLTESMAQNGWTKKDETDYFKFIVSPSSSDDDIEISLTPLTGDPNMVISYTPGNQFPTVDDGEYDLLSMRVGPDTAVVKAADWYKKNPGCLPGNPLLGSPTCQLIIGVFCISTECTYSVKASSSKSEFHMLVNG